MNSKTTTPEAAVEPAIQAATAPEAPASKPLKKKNAPKTKANLTLADLAEKYIRHLDDQGKSSGTCSSYGAEPMVPQDSGETLKATGRTYSAPLEKRKSGFDAFNGFVWSRRTGRDSHAVRW
jgi:hypothetical protein